MDLITLSHGSGGKLMHKLIEELFYKHFGNEILLQQNDASILPRMEGRIAVTTDSFVVHPIVFPGGDIGKLAVCGTVNDLAMSGAVPLYITVGFIIEEGLPFTDLERIVTSLGQTAKEANVKIVAGDTKVVERGSADQIFINTTGIGVLQRDFCIGGEQAEPGDVILINGTLGDHGITVMSQRNHFDFELSLISDCGLLHDLIQEVLRASDGVKVLRDPTRGGLAVTLHEIAQQSKVSMCLKEEEIPVKEEVQAMCEIMGYDPLYIANEGKVIVIVKKEDAENVLAAMKRHPMGKEAAIIGEVLQDHRQHVYVKTAIGGTRLLHMPTGELLPRIC